MVNHAEAHGLLLRFMAKCFISDTTFSLLSLCRKMCQNMFFEQSVLFRFFFRKGYFILLVFEGRLDSYNC